MASKRGTTKPSSAADEIDELFEGIGDKKTAPAPTKTPTASSKPKGPSDDILAELENELDEKKAPSRPHTPRISKSKVEPRASLEERQRKSAESSRSPAAAATFTPTSDMPEAEKNKGAAEQAAAQQQHQQQQAAAAGGGWWGGLLSTATAAMKQAEAAVTQIQQNEEAKKWADQVRGNVGALRGLGKSLAGRTFLVKIEHHPSFPGFILFIRALWNVWPGVEITGAPVLQTEWDNKTGEEIANSQNEDRKSYTGMTEAVRSTTPGQVALTICQLLHSKASETQGPA